MIELLNYVLYEGTYILAIYILFILWVHNFIFPYLIPFWCKGCHNHQTDAEDLQIVTSYRTCTYATFCTITQKVIN
jgi:hypothetical protein